MKKILLLFCFISSMQTAFAQDLSRQNANKIDSLKRVLSSTSKPIERFNIMLILSETISFHAGDPDSALCTQLLQIAQELQNDSLLAISYDLIGQYARTSGDNTGGLDYFFKAIPLAEKSKDKRRLSSIYFDMASVYFYLQNNEEYGRYIRKGGENMPDKSHPMYDFMLAQYQRGMATYFVQSHQPDSALVYAHPLITTSQRINSQLYLFNAYFLNAAIQDESGDKEMAALYFKKALNAAVATSAYSQLRFASIYIPYLLRNKNFGEAKQQAMQLINGFASNNNRLSGAGYLRQTYDSMGRSDSAYFYAKEEIRLNQIVFNQNNNNKIQALAFNEQIRSMEENARQKSENEKRKQNLQFALIALGIIVLITLYLLLSRSFITNTKLIQFFGVIALLIVFEFLNLLLHPFLERITNHSPLLMLLSLVCIAALLVPLHHKLQKWATIKLVEKNKQIRLKAAKKTIEQLDNT